jgi:vancomycin permeability regulator SanA
MAEETARGKRKRLWRKAALVAAAGAALGLLALAGASACVKFSARGRTYDDLQAIPHRRVGLLLGCPRIVTHRRLNFFFRYRIEAAVELFQAGKVDCLLVSGDNLSDGCTEAADMREDLIRAGVPAGKIYCDFAGLRTLDSVVRAREVFGQTELTVISQKFHNERAIFIARRRGLDAIGFNARMPWGFFGFLNLCREQFARVRAVLDAYLLDTQPRFLDGKTRIGTRAMPPARWPRAAVLGIIAGTARARTVSERKENVYGAYVRGTQRHDGRSASRHRQGCPG